MSEKNIKKIGIRDALGEYIYTDIGVDADKVDIDSSTNLAEKLVEIDNKFEDLKAGGYANKNIYGDEKINLGRKVGTAAGPYSVTIGRDVSAAGTCSLAEGNGTAASGNYSHSEGNGTIAGGENSHSEGYGTIASGQTQHVQGRYNVEDTNDRYAHIVGGGSKMERKNIHTLDWYGNAEFAGDVQGYDSTTGKKVSLLDKATIYGDTTINVGRKENSTVGEYSTAEGYNTTASGKYSHAEGTSTTASRDSSHAEGYYTKANGDASHAEGGSTKAIGKYSHAEGGSTAANGDYSHSEGFGTIASGLGQHVQGKYNVEDTEDKYAHIVGCGTAMNDRKNIHTLDWQGNAEFAGDVKCSNVLKTLTECEASTTSTDIAGASALAELTNVKTVTYSFLGSDIYDWGFYFANVIQVGKLTIINGRIQSGVNVSLPNIAWIEVMQLSAKPTDRVYGICNSPNGKDVNFSSYIDGNGKLFIAPDRELTNSGILVDILFAFQAV